MIALNLVTTAARFVADHPALLTASATAVYLAATGRYLEAIGTAAAALSAGLKRPAPSQ